MKVSEFLAALERHNWDALVFVSSANNLFSVESVVKEKDEVHLMAQPVPTTAGSGTAMSRDTMLAKALLQGVTGKVFNVKIISSVQNPEKFQLEVDSVALPQEFDTQNEAMAFMQGFTFGFSVGGGIKEMADGVPSRLT